MEALAKVWWRAVQTGFHLLYNQLAFTYDFVSVIVSLGEWRSWQRTVLRYLPAETNSLILELAHGTGNLQIDLIQAGYSTIGYDVSPYMGTIAKRKLQQRTMPVNLVRGQAQHLPFPTAALTTVVTTFPTNFIFAAETLREVHRILVNGGQLIIVPNGTLTGSGIIATGIEWLYHITGQHGDSNIHIADFFGQYGFEVTVHEVRCKRSIAQIILARKKV